MKQLDEATLEYNLPAAPPGAHTPRAIGSTEYAPMDSDAYVGPAGECPVLSYFLGESTLHATPFDPGLA